MARSLSWIPVTGRKKPNGKGSAKVVVDDSIFFETGGSRYVAWIPQSKAATLSASAVSLATVVPHGSLTVFDASSLKRHVHYWSEEDDVFATDFLESIVFQDPICKNITSSLITPALTSLFEDWKTDQIAYAPESSLPLQGGPHLLLNDDLVPVQRLHDDRNQTLVCTTRHKSPLEMELLNDGRHGLSCSSVAVPSRMAVNGSKGLTLGSFRVVVKDVIDIAGLPTSNCCWSYLRLHKKASASAPLIQTLLEAKSPILGKTKLSSFLTREEAAESVDFQTSWNPRADGYQSTGGSSSGSAAAVAAYEWLDVAIGSDTNGSVRRPAQCNGVFGIRPSRGAFSPEGMFTVFKDLRMLHAFSSLIYPSEYKTKAGKNLPIAIVAPTDFDNEDMSTSQRRSIDEFVDDLGSYANIPVERISIRELWNSKPPEDAHGAEFYDYLSELGLTTFLYSNYWNSGKLFLEEFRKAFDEKPYVTPFVQWRWDQGAKVSEQQFEEGMHRLKVYASWFLTNVMHVGEKFTLLVTPSENVKPLYRDDPPPQYYVQPAWNQWWISSVTGSPELCLPVGQIPYHSRISGKEEVLPCLVDVMAQPGADLELMKYFEKFLLDCGRPSSVMTGRKMFKT